MPQVSVAAWANEWNLETAISSHLYTCSVWCCTRHKLSDGIAGQKSVILGSKISELQIRVSCLGRLWPYCAFTFRHKYHRRCPHAIWAWKPPVRFWILEFASGGLVVLLMFVSYVLLAE
jgi:hypothetical protein